MQREVFFVSCTKGLREDTLLHRSFKKMGLFSYHFVENNRRGLSEVYNEWIDRFAGSDLILVLMHDDICLPDVMVKEKLLEGSKSFDVLGLAGANRFNLDSRKDLVAWWASPRETLSGGVEHPTADGKRLYTSYGPTPRSCVVLDGLFIALDMKRIGKLRFDPRFTFHFYDLDFCLQANREGYRLGTASVYAFHNSRGAYRSDSYKAGLEVFREKWRPLLGSPPVVEISPEAYQAAPARS